MALTGFAFYLSPRCRPRLFDYISKASPQRSIPLICHWLIPETKHQSPTIKIRYLVNVSDQDLPTHPSIDFPPFSLKIHSCKKQRKNPAGASLLATAAVFADPHTTPTPICLTLQSIKSPLCWVCLALTSRGTLSLTSVVLAQTYNLNTFRRLGQEDHCEFGNTVSFTSVWTNFK